MIKMSRNSTDGELLEAVYVWLAFLEAGDYAGATESIRHVKNRAWDGEYLRKAITEYRQEGVASDTQPPKITSYANAKALDHDPMPNVTRFAPNDSGLFGAVDNFSLPINGFWSHLTADFVILNGPDPNDDCILYLEEISCYDVENYRFWFG